MTAAKSASTRYEVEKPSAIAARPPDVTMLPPTMNGSRLPRPCRSRRSLQIPVTSGTAIPAAALTSMTIPISWGASSIRSRRSGR
jgi:hypothetical protein